MPARLRILLAALCCTLLGVILYRLQGPSQSVMNAWGIVSFTAVGASLGCLLSEDDKPQRGLDFLRGWWS